MDWNQTFKAAAFVVMAMLPSAGGASSEGGPLPAQDWGHIGIFGHFDQAALKRGAQIASEVCLNCHSLKYIKYEQLKAVGFDEKEIKEMASNHNATKKDPMISLMKPEDAKQAYGTVPPDLSLIVKARKGFEDYVYDLLTGFPSEEETAKVKKIMANKDPSEADLVQVATILNLEPHPTTKVKEEATKFLDGANFNKYFPGHFLAMPQPLNAGQVKFKDGTDGTLNQLSKDVTIFLAWASEPTQMERKSLGIKVILYLVVLTAMLYAYKRRVWAKVH